MSIQIPSGQQPQRGCSLWWVVALALLVGVIGLLLALRPWERDAAAVAAEPAPTPVPGWESYRGTAAALGTLTAAGREGIAVATPTIVVMPVPQVAVQPVVTAPQVAIQPAVLVPQVAAQPVVLPPAGSMACPQCSLDPAFAAAYATWYRAYMAWHSEYTAWYQAWMAHYGGRPQPAMVSAGWQPGAGPAQGMRPGPMPGPNCGPQPGRPAQPWAYTR